MRMKNCPNCGKELFAFAQRCDSCGLRGLLGEQITPSLEPEPRSPASKPQIVVDMPECPKLRGYYCSADPENCLTPIKPGVCYSCDFAVHKAAHHRKLKAEAKLTSGDDNGELHIL